MSSCQFCEIFKNTFFYRTSPVTASEDGNLPPRTEFSVLNVPVKFKLKICQLNKMLVSLLVKVSVINKDGTVSFPSALSVVNVSAGIPL